MSFTPDGYELDKGEFELEERRALRRVEGLSTELEDITEVEYRKLLLERVVLVGVWTQGSIGEAERSMTELARLAETAGCTVVDALIQRREAPDSATFIGSGKVKELRQIVVAEGADTVICDGELTPSQLRKLEETIKVKVVDRTWLILDIFAQHARSFAQGDDFGMGRRVVPGNRCVATAGDQLPILDHHGAHRHFARSGRFARLRQGQGHPVFIAGRLKRAHTSPSFLIQAASACS